MRSTRVPNSKSIATLRVNFLSGHICPRLTDRVGYAYNLVGWLGAGERPLPFPSSFPPGTYCRCFIGDAGILLVTTRRPHPTYLCHTLDTDVPNNNTSLFTGVHQAKAGGHLALLKKFLARDPNDRRRLDLHKLLLDPMKSTSAP